MAQYLTYEQLMDYAKKHYNKGGDVTFECLDRKDFEEMKPMTKRDALRMFAIDYEEEKAAKYFGEW